MIKAALTPLQEAFLDALFSDECRGNIKAAMIVAGYSPHTRTYEVVRPLSDQIVERTKQYIAAHGPQAFMTMAGVMNDPSSLGAKNAIAAAKDIMDRAGLAKAQELEVNTGSSMFILPAKRVDDN